MIPVARVGHQLDGRLRIRIPSRKQSPQYFRKVANALSRCKGVEAVQVNPRTGGILVHHDTDLASIRAYANKHGLFLIETTQDTRPISRRVSDRFDKIDRDLIRKTHGKIDITALSATLLLTLSAVQVLNGRLLPPAWTLFQSALEKLRWPTEKEGLLVKESQRPG